MNYIKLSVDSRSLRSQDQDGGAVRAGTGDSDGISRGSSGGELPAVLRPRVPQCSHPPPADIPLPLCQS